MTVKKQRVVVVDSRTGLGRQFAAQLDRPIHSIDEPITKRCILITRNEGLGKIPQTTIAFLDKYSGLVDGVVVNGMKRYGPFFCKAADKIKKAYGLTIIARIETSGTTDDVTAVKKYIESCES